MNENSPITSLVSVLGDGEEGEPFPLSGLNEADGGLKLKVGSLLRTSGL
jgi:hypothetical protein